jgi:ferredoxin
MRLFVAEEQCCSSGMCTLIAPDVFDQDASTGEVVLLNPQPPPADHEAVRQAIQACPCHAIGEEDTG